VKPSTGFLGYLNADEYEWDDWDPDGDPVEHEISGFSPVDDDEVLDDVVDGDEE
jgi:hypothetical protein